MKSYKECPNYNKSLGKHHKPQTMKEGKWVFGCQSVKECRACRRCPQR